MLDRILTVKGKILMTVLTVVLMFALFILFYFPARQERYLIENYNEEVENFAKTVALGVKIALTEQNFEGVETAIDFVRDDERLVFVSLIQTDTVQTENNTGFEIQKTVFKSFPENVEVNPNAVSSKDFIIKSALFSTPIMTGEILLSFSTEEIIKSRNQIRNTSIVVSLIVFFIGLIIGFWLARNISKPVLALRDAANKVGEGDLTQSVRNDSSDEIGELSIAFNKMVRDLNVESVLERIRTRGMAMQKSSDSQNVMRLGMNDFHQVVSSLFCGVGVINFGEKQFTVYSNSNTDTDEVRKSIIKNTSHPFFTEMYKAWKSKELFYYELEGLDLLAFYDFAKKTNFQFPDGMLVEIPSFYKQFCYGAPFAHGILFILRNTPLENAEIQTLQRFANAFHITYSKWMELQNAELRAREEIQQASLDRVRGEIASMRTKDDLQSITPLIWKELKVLGVPFFRCGVFIVDESTNSVQSYLSNPDGIALGVFPLHYSFNQTAKNIIDHWREKTMHFEHWDKTYFLNFMQSLVEKGHIKNEETYQGSSKPPESLDLHFVPFKQGMLYVGSTSPLDKKHLSMVKLLAEAFSMAYDRYEDFNKLEKAKNQVDSALSELKSTQSQLIHAEKMASLGELTAGIAHEIQNPLNFVNNFSEINKELLEELKEELENGKIDEVKQLADDTISNEEKIRQHGMRADSIVKGMLQHSRTSQGEKESTDINALADEYLRLAYHGMRAKDKSFNADFKLNLDTDLPKVKVISQDIGRVLLNLINNAFYAVDKKAKEGSNGYKPEVMVSTHQIDGKIEINVRDNGEGIPEQVQDKIFQPFFTTKPTGSGTGLGLSLSYDIVKAHGGEIKVNSKDGEGTEFTIKIPIT